MNFPAGLGELAQTMGVPATVFLVVSYFLFMHLRAERDKPLTPDTLSKRLRDIEDDIERLERNQVDCSKVIEKFDLVRDRVTVLWDQHERRRRQ